MFFFFFKQKTAYEMRISDWSSDVCSSDLQATAVEVRLADPQQARQAANEIMQAIGPQYRLYDWQQANAHFVNALDVERNVMFLIPTLIIVVAAFNLISSMITLVKDKGRDSSLLHTPGELGRA